MSGGDVRSTERRNPRTLDLDLLPSAGIVSAVVAEDLRGVEAVAGIAEAIGAAVDAAAERVRSGGRVHAFGAGASGRLALLDATEATPTYGVPRGMLDAHFPGGAEAFFDSSIDMEDADGAGYDDAADVRAGDVVLGVTASGGTAYVRGALERAGEAGALRLLVTTEPTAALAGLADVVLCADTGAEAVTGSTRLKAGTATKVVLNAFSTALMVRLGRTYSNLMVGLVATNAKLRERAVTVVEMGTGLARAEAGEMLERAAGDPALALVIALSGRSADESRAALSAAGSVRSALASLGGAS